MIRLLIYWCFSNERIQVNVSLSGIRGSGFGICSDRLKWNHVLTQNISEHAVSVLELNFYFLTEAINGA
jgi:hypothetical protein